MHPFHHIPPKQKECQTAISCTTSENKSILSGDVIMFELPLLGHILPSPPQLQLSAHTCVLQGISVASEDRRASLDVVLGKTTEALDKDVQKQRYNAEDRPAFWHVKGQN